MQIPFKALTLAALVAASPLALSAQSTSDDGAASTGSSIEDQLSFGEVTKDTAEIGQTYTDEVNGAWELRCIKTEADTDPCQMYQLMDDGQGQPVAEISLFRLPEGGRAVAGATLVVPLETALPQQVSLSVDGGKARRYPYAFCNPVGCYARIGLTEPDIAAFKAGNEAVVTIVPALAPDQLVTLTMSLAGFTASFDKASVIDQ